MDEEALGHHPCATLSLQNPAEGIKLGSHTGVRSCCNLWMSSYHEVQWQVAEYGVFQGMQKC